MDFESKRMMPRNEPGEARTIITQDLLRRFLEVLLELERLRELEGQIVRAALERIDRGLVRRALSSGLEADAEAVAGALGACIRGMIGHEAAALPVSLDVTYDDLQEALGIDGEGFPTAGGDDGGVNAPGDPPDKSLPSGPDEGAAMWGRAIVLGSEWHRKTFLILSGGTLDGRILVEDHRTGRRAVVRPLESEIFVRVALSEDPEEGGGP